MVQPAPTPPSTKPENASKIRAFGTNQNLILFKRGKCMSGTISIKGTNQLPNPPIITGITIKKIIIRACLVMIRLYSP